uniref:Ring finger protein 151 n=1 Tax=Canis lupus familiaris TaxID=9615 RepID=A0A8C0PB81_CANLF
MAPRRGCEPPHPTAASSRRPGPRAAAGDTETHVFSRRRRTSPRGGSIYPTPSTARSRVPRPEREPIRAVEARSQAPRPAPRALAHIGSALLLPRAAAARLLALRVGPRCRTQTPRSAASCRPPPQLLQPGSRGSAGPGPTPHSFHSSRQKTCPCCRKEVKRKKMVHVNKLRRTIGRLEVKCKNAEAGCSVTCPLAHRRGHQDSCPFELMACPHEGCTARVPRGALAEHRQHCPHGAQERCPLGCGATLGPVERARHNCYRELREAWSQRQERSRTLVLGLLRRMREVHRTANLVRRQLAQLGGFLEEEDVMLVGAPQGEAEATPEGSMGAEMWGAQGQGTL